MSTGGMVTAMHPLAAEAGVAVLRSGGNAADAAIAAILASGVVEPYMSGLGGAAYAVSFDIGAGDTRCYDGAARVPQGAREDMFEPAPPNAPAEGLYGWRATRDDASETGARSVGVPGALACLGRLHAERGRRSWESLFEPAMLLAKNGFEVDDYYFTSAAASESRLRSFPETSAIFLNADGTAPMPPDRRLRQPALAATLGEIARDGARSFYEGRIANEIVSFLRERGGVLASSDLASYAPTESRPVRVRYHGFDVSLLAEGSGGPTVARALGLLAEQDIAKWSFYEPARFAAIAEALGTSFTERLSASKDPPDQHTTHVNVIDAERNMVAITATLGARFGSAVTVPSLGVVLNNGMMWFDPEPGRPHSIRPGARALHAAAPCLVFEEGRPFAALGAPGARRIMSAVVQVLVAVLDHAMGAQASVEAPRVQTEGGKSLVADARLPRAVIEQLRKSGYDVSRRADDLVQSHFGRPSIIIVDRASGSLRGGVEAFRSASAVGHGST